MLKKEEHRRDPTDSLEQILRALPDRLTREILRVGESQSDFASALSEIRLHAGRQTYLTLAGRNLPLSVTLSGDEIAGVVRVFCAGSVYAYSDCLKRGYLPLPGGCRAGVAGEFVCEGGKITGIRTVGSVVIRIARWIPGTGELAEAVFRRNGCRRGLLIFSPPGCGKTTVLRDLAVRLSCGARPLRTAIVDCRCEIAGDWLGRGACVEVLSGCGKGEGIAMAVRTLSPEVILVDEIGGCEDIAVIRQNESGGVPMIATVHGSDFALLSTRSPVASLIRAGVFGGYVGIMRDENGGFCQYEAVDPDPILPARDQFTSGGRIG